MHWKIFFVFFLGSVSADGYTCARPINIDAPDDLSRSVYWPSNWNESLPPAQFEADQQCEWEVAVPYGSFSTVVFYKSAPNTHINLEYPNFRLEGLADNDHSPFILTSPSFKVTLLRANAPGAFSFKVTWSKYPVVVSNPIELAKGESPVAMAPNAHLTTFVAQTNVSLVAFQLKDASQNSLLRQSAVYDGDSTNGTFLGNLLSIMQANRAVISSGTALTVYTFGLDEVFNYTLYMAQDHSNDQGLVIYRGVNCISDTQCPIVLEAMGVLVAVATVDARPEFIKNITTFPDNATLKVYEGVISDATLVTTLTQANYKYRLPMELKNTIRQYVLDSGRLQMDLSRDANDAEWTKMYDGRKGFVHSFNHGALSSKQETDETFTTLNSEKLFLNYIVRDADFTGSQTALTVAVWMGGQEVSSTTYNATNLPPTTTSSVQGDTFEVKYQNHEVPTKGFRVDFSTTATGYVTGMTTLGTPTTSITNTSTSPTASPSPLVTAVTSSSSVGSSVTTTAKVVTTTKSSTDLSSILAIITGSLLLLVL